MASATYEDGNIIDILIQTEMRQSFMDYAMSVIVSRALPDARDGLKPVHRRILFAMHELGMTPDKPFKKSARLVGEVLGKYHPHGDQSVYDAMVRLAQDFPCRYPLADGHGNFGSVDGDPAAAMRYTEARLSRLSVELLADIEADTVDYSDNFDGTLKEPIVLPSMAPNLLLNGSTGIAVGMATNIPPHNLTEVCRAVQHLIAEPEATTEELGAFVLGPDFPTGGIIMGTRGIREAQLTGRGSVTVRAVCIVEEVRPGRMAIIVNELPYQVNKARLIEHIADLVRDKKIDGISDLRDESDRDGMRMVIELKRDAVAQVVLNNLYKQTQMQDNFSVNLLALINRRPRTMGLRECLTVFLEHRFEVVTRRTQYFLKKAEDRDHLVTGFLTILDKLDAAVLLIRAANSTEEARTGLMQRFQLSERQANAVLDMQLRRLTAMEKNKLDNEHAELQAKITDYKDILAKPERIYAIIHTELEGLIAKFGDARRRRLTPDLGDFRHEDLIPNEPMACFMTEQGYIKRVHMDTFEAQHRGGRGVAGITARENDFIRHFFIGTAHMSILIFTNRGVAYHLKVYELPEASRTARGSSIANLLALNPDEKVTAIIPVEQFTEDHFLIMLTHNGVIKKTELKHFANVRRNGLIAIDLDEGDGLGWVCQTDGTKDLIVGTRNGMAIRFNESDNLRALGRTARGVRAVTLRDGDGVVGLDLVEPNRQVLVVTTDGYGKRTAIEEYRLQSRGGVGLINVKLRKGAKVASLLGVDGDEEIMIVTKSGVVIRQKVAQISVFGRGTQGVRLQKLGKDDEIVAVAQMAIVEDDKTEGDAAGSPALPEDLIDGVLAESPDGELGASPDGDGSVDGGDDMQTADEAGPEAGES
ncbi:MAG: DNA gyrase subunit A [Candidatus Sericytochromatia bacterium]|nr:DNA gyrase subunit A [Candidatus Sericytochromatia bacterium]